jgi:hypothetical protein
MAERQYPTASLSISFQTEIFDPENPDAPAEAHLSVAVEADDNGGKSSFLFGDTVYYRVFKTPNITSLIVVTSDGSENGHRTGLTAEVQQAVAFTGSDVAGVSGYLHRLISASAMGGASLGAISKAGPTSIRCSKQSTGPLDPLVGVYNVRFETRYDLRRLSNVAQPAGFGVDGFTSYPVVVYLVGVL